jgi:hypothetical protein
MLTQLEDKEIKEEAKSLDYLVEEMPYLAHR